MACLKTIESKKYFLNYFPFLYSRIAMLELYPSNII